MMKLEMLRIDSVMLYVENLEETARFYEEELGLKRGWTDMEHGMIGLLFPKGETELVLHSDPEIPSPTFAIQVEDVEAYCREYRRRGHRVLMNPIEVRCGKYAVIADPEGNPIPIIDLTKFEGKPRYDEDKKGEETKRPKRPFYALTASSDLIIGYMSKVQRSSQSRTALWMSASRSASITVKPLLAPIRVLTGYMNLTPSEGLNCSAKRLETSRALAGSQPQTTRKRITFHPISHWYLYSSPPRS